MSLSFLNYIDLPAHEGQGAFDHAAIHQKSRQLYLAHTANNALDVIDLRQEKFSRSIRGLKSIAGVLVSDEGDLVFTSNRGEDTVGIFRTNEESRLEKIQVGCRPNGLAFDFKNGLLLVANVGNPAQPETYTLSIINIAEKKIARTIPTAGRSRWAIFNPITDSFYVNIGTPSQIMIIPSGNSEKIPRAYDVPVEGAHGLDIDSDTGRLFCACDGKQLITLDVLSGKVLGRTELSGSPDVIFFNPILRHLYVAIGDPGVIDIIETQGMTKVGTTVTEFGAHTIAFDAEKNHIYSFLPKSHRAAIYVDRSS